MERLEISVSHEQPIENLLRFDFVRRPRGRGVDKLNSRVELRCLKSTREIDSRCEITGRPTNSGGKGGRRVSASSRWSLSKGAGQPPYAEAGLWGGPRSR